MISDLINKKDNSTLKKIALISNNKEYTYAELWRNISRLSKWIDLNYDKHSRIGVLLDNCEESVFAFFAIIISGRICVPIDYDIHIRNLKFLINDTSIDLLFTSSKYIYKIDELNTDISFDIILTDNFAEDRKYKQILDEIIFNPYYDKLDLPFTNKDKTASIFYTTGTTGPKKGVMLSQNNLLSSTKNINEFMKIGSTIIESVPMRISHSFGFARIRCILDVGGTIILENGFLRPEKVLKNIKTYKANAISSVPAGFAILLDRYKPLFKDISSQIEYIEIGSSYMRENQKKILMSMCPKARICMHYGSTEASRSTFIEFNSEQNKLSTIGKPSPNVRVKILKENKELKGNVGEILVKGQMTSSGYWNNKKMTKENIISGWIKTGDLGKIDNDGYIHLLGRKEEVINLGGLKIAPGEIEEVLLKHDDIIEAAVIGIRSDNLLTQNLKAFIVSNNKNISNSELESFCLKNLEPYKIPNSFKILSSLPKTHSGKIKKNELR